MVKIMIRQKNNKDRKQYLKTCKKYNKELKKLFKNYGPWDNYTDCFLDIQIRHWIDYYTLGYNVVAQEVKDTPEFNQPDRPTRLEIAKKLYELHNNYVDFKYDKEDYLGDDGHLDVDKINEGYRKAKREFFDYYIKYADDMWD